jgi:hypothetical protein
MQCPGCGFQNPDGMRFCGKCGASIGVTCARCRFENPPGFEFCGKCGAPLASTQRVDSPLRGLDPHSYTPKHLVAKILTSRSALEGERKQVTVLFADVKGSIALAEQVDPKEWHNSMDHSVRHHGRALQSLARIAFCPWQGSAFSEARLVAPHASRQYERPWSNAASS